MRPTHQGHREVTQILGPDVPHTPRSQGSVPGPGTWCAPHTQVIGNLSSPGTLYCASRTKVIGNLSSPGTLYCASHTKVKGKCVKSWNTVLCLTHQGQREVCQVLGHCIVPHTPRSKGTCQVLGHCIVPHTPRSKGSVSSPGTLYCASHTKVKGKCVRSWDTVLCLTHQGQRELVKSWDTVLCLTHQGHREVCQVLGPDLPHTPRLQGSVSGPGT